MKDERSASALAALEALFAPRKPAAQPDATQTPTPGPTASKAGARSSAKMVSARAYQAGEAADAKNETDARKAERAKLAGRLGAAVGRPAVTRCANDVLAAGFTFTHDFDGDQDVQLALLEHSDETHVRDGLGVLSRLLGAQPPKRKTVLEARLRWLEEAADEATTRELAAALRRRVLGARTSMKA